MSDTITVKSKKELAELLMSGGEWEAASGEYKDTVFYYDEVDSSNPFVYKDKSGYGYLMNIGWECKQWRKVKYQPKENEVCIAWNDTETETAGIVVYEKGVSNAHNYAPYTGIIPPHIQKFLDELED